MFKSYSKEALNAATSGLELLDSNISEEQAQNLWSNKVASIFVDDPTEYI